MEVVPLDDTRKAAALAHADHIHFVFRLELVYENAVARLQVAVAAVQLELADKENTFGAGLLQMAPLRLRHAVLLSELDESELDGVVSVAGRRLALDHHA